MIFVSCVFLCVTFSSQIEAAGLKMKSVPQVIREAGYPVESHTVDSRGYLLTVHRIPQQSQPSHSNQYCPQPQVIREAGYPVESHTVDSRGYLLTVHRIPQQSQPSATSVMMVHGLFCSAIDYVMQGRGEALAFLLHDAGLDIWIPNLRGSTNSLRHKTLKPSQKDFWDYTFEEMGTEDILILTDYILKLTGNEKIAVVTNSMGGTSVLTGLAVRPEYNRKFHQLVMFGPHSNMKSTSGNVRLLSHLKPQLEIMSQTLNIYQIPPNNYEGVSNLLYNICKTQSYEENICMAVHNVIIGNGALIDFPQFLEYIKYYPTPMSVKGIVHIFQTMGADKFARFDYGRKKNIQVYGTPYPTPYNLSQVTAPVFMVYAKNDNLVPPEDIRWLMSQLPNVIETIYVTRSDFGHSSFLWHPNIMEIAYKRIVSSISNFVDNNV